MDSIEFARWTAEKYGGLMYTIVRVFLVMVSAASSLLAQEPTRGMSIETVRPIILSFNQLAERFDEVRYRPEVGAELNASFSYVRHTRTEVCALLDSESGRAAVRQIYEAVESIDIDNAGLQEMAQDDESFNEFLQNEGEYLEQAGLSEQAVVYVVILVRDHRQTLVGIQTPLQGSASVALDQLCSSPVENTDNRYSWRSWVMPAIEFVGGLAIVAANVAVPMPPPASLVSVALGGTFMNAGYTDLRNLSKGNDNR